MYPVAPTCSIRSLNFISVLILFLFTNHSQGELRMSVWKIYFVFPLVIVLAIVPFAPRSITSRSTSTITGGG